MTTDTLIGLVVQAVAVSILFWRLGRAWLRHVGVVFILAAVVYTGVGEILVEAFPGQSQYRALLVGQTRYVGQYTLLASITILALTVTYLVVLGHDTRTAIGHRGELLAARRILDWRLLGLFSVFAVLLTVRGVGYSAILTAAGTISTTSGIVLQFILVAVPLAAFSLVAILGRRWLAPALIVVILAIAVTGERGPIVFASLAFLYACARFGIRFSRPAVIIGVIAFVLVGLVITSARANSGRTAFAAGGGAAAKIGAVSAGITGITDNATFSQLKHDFGYRLDGNSWGALVMESYAAGLPPAGPRSLINDFRDAIPSLIYRSKLSQNATSLAEGVYQLQALDLPTIEVTGLPTQLGTILGYWGPIGLLLVGPVLGMIFAVADRWLLRRATALSLVIGVGLVICAASYEHALNVYPETLRGVVVLALVVWAFEAARRSVGAAVTRRQAPAVDSGAATAPGGPTAPLPRRRAQPMSAGRFEGFEVDWEN